MNMLKSDWNRRDGTATLTVLGLVVVVCAMLAVMAGAAAQRSYMARKLTDRARALMYAEAGANEAYTRIEQDWGLTTNAAAFPQTSYGLGWYDVTVTRITNNMAVIQSAGNCGVSDMAVILDIVNYGPPGTPGATWDPTAFDYGVLCGGEFDFGGCGDISGSTGGVSIIHANGDMFLRGNASSDLDIRSSTEIRINNNVDIDGDVTAPDLRYKASKVDITGTATETVVDMVAIPDIDLTPYYNWALAHGEVHNGLHLSGGTYNANGGIIWVQGDCHITSHTVINGSIIATGDINFSGAADLTPTTTAFGLASRDGSIQFTTSGHVQGLIYVRTGDFDHTANGQITGQIVVNGNIKKAGNSGIFAFSECVPTPPGAVDPTAGHDIIGVSAWQQ